MSLQSLWTLIAGHPAQALNAVALFLALAGSWLLLATRWREMRALAMLPAGRASRASPAPSERVNVFFFRFAGMSLFAALALSWFSTRF